MSEKRHFISMDEWQVGYLLGVLDARPGGVHPKIKSVHAQLQALVERITRERGQTAPGTKKDSETGR